MDVNLKTARRILAAFCVLMVGAFVLCGATGIRWLGYLGIGFAFAGAVSWILLGRCPTCGKFLGRSDGKYCPHCGAKLEE